MGSADGDLPGLGDHRGLLGQGQLQDAVVVGGGDAALVDAADIEGAGEGPVPALPADIGALVSLLLLGLLVGGLDGEDAFLQLQGDLLLGEAGQLGLQQELVAQVTDVRAEGGQVGVGVAKELLLKVVEHVEQVVVAAVKGDHTEHHKTLLHENLFRLAAGGPGPTGVQNLQS